MKTIKFDFYNANKELWLQNFCQAFSLNQKDVREFFRNSIDSDITPNNIVSIFNPNLKHYDSSSIEIVCRHMTTTNDIEISNFKKVGLLDLRNVLRINSPLSQYMHQNGISIDIDNKEIQINDIKYHITLHGEPCQKCVKKLTKRCQSLNHQANRPLKFHKMFDNDKIQVRATLRILLAQVYIHKDYLGQRET